MRASQENQAKAAADLQQASLSQMDQANQQTAIAAKQAESGFKAALSEIGQGLQKIAANNPSLVPDVKNLYESVSSKLSVASNPQQAQAQSQITEAFQKGIQAPASQ